jgi:integrase
LSTAPPCSPCTRAATTAACASRSPAPAVGITRRLAETLAALPRTGPFVFDNKGSHYKDHNKTWLMTIVRYAGLPWQGTHILRKTCGTRIADNGGGVSAVASHLRHKNLQTASRYIDRRGGTSGALKALES